MDHIKIAKKHLLMNLLLLSCAMLLLAVYASGILANSTVDQPIISQPKSTPVAPKTENTGDIVKEDPVIPVDTKEITAPVVTKDSTDTTSNPEETTGDSKSTISATPEKTIAPIINRTVDTSTKSPTIDITPNLTFSNLSDGKTIQNEIAILGEVEIAKSVEFYLILENSNTKKYIGTATRQSENTWKLNFDSKNFPNGSFSLIAKIENIYGSYESGRVKIIINNPTSTENSTNTGLANNQTPEVGQAQLPNYNDRTSTEWQKKYFGNEYCQKEIFCGGNVDPDNDSISNNEELRYNSNPLNPDTDGDGFIDSDEIKNGFDPLKYSSGDGSDKIVFENPKENGEIKNELYKITNIESITVNDKKQIKITGKGLPNSFITIYIYSSLPIILTVKTDENGDWSYILDKQLDDGSHEVYIAITDNTGKITAKSDPLPFVSIAGAVSIKDLDNRIEASTPPLQSRANSDMLLVGAIILLSLGLVFSIVSINTVYKATREKI
ncbi:MAG: Ig-like domain-containing protein [Candidatus Moraniibacteriota bacterium]